MTFVHGFWGNSPTLDPKSRGRTRRKRSKEEEEEEEEFMEFKSFSGPHSEIHIIKSQD